MFSNEGSLISDDKLSLTTAGIGAVLLNVSGRASHAGSAPERGRNALYELAHQILQMRDLSDPAVGVKMNWTIASAGTNRNVIPAIASRGRRRACPARRRLRRRRAEGARAHQEAAHRGHQGRDDLRAPPSAARIDCRPRRHSPSMRSASTRRSARSSSSATWPRAAAPTLPSRRSRPRRRCIERFGLRGFGAHSNDAEYVDIDSIEPRLYLLTRMIMDVAQDKATQ